MRREDTGRKDQRGTRGSRRNSPREERGGDWRELMRIATEENKKKKKSRTPEFRGEEPDFSEEGWARRKPKRKK